MTEEQINAIRVALEVLQQYGLIPNRPIAPGTEAQALQAAANTIKEKQTLAEVGHIILPLEREQELLNILRTAFLGKPNTHRTRASAKVLAQNFLHNLKERDLLPPGRFFRFRLDQYEITLTGPF